MADLGSPSGPVQLEKAWSHLMYVISARQRIRLTALHQGTASLNATVRGTKWH